MEKYDFNGYRRVYLVHIRKTGGTSLNQMFLSLSKEKPERVYSDLASKPAHRVLRNGLVFVGWDRTLIRRGNWFYAFSHTPLHELSLPERTFTFTCFRDPVKRVVSHYKMLVEHAQNDSKHPMMAREGAWIGSSFDDFLERIPPEHLLRQLYMFSPNFDVDEAVSQVNSLSHYFFLKSFDKGVEELNRRTGLELSPIHTRSTVVSVEVSEEQLTRLRSKLDPEYRMLSELGWS